MYKEQLMSVNDIELTEHQDKWSVHDSIHLYEYVPTPLYEFRCWIADLCGREKPAVRKLNKNYRHPERGSVHYTVSWGHTTDTPTGRYFMSIPKYRNRYYHLRTFECESGKCSCHR